MYLLSLQLRILFCTQLATARSFHICAGCVSWRIFSSSPASVVASRFAFDICLALSCHVLFCGALAMFGFDSFARCDEVLGVATECGSASVVNDGKASPPSSPIPVPPSPFVVETSPSSFDVVIPKSTLHPRCEPAEGSPGVEL